LLDPDPAEIGPDPATLVVGMVPVPTYRSCTTLSGERLVALGLAGAGYLRPANSGDTPHPSPAFPLPSLPRFFVLLFAVLRIRFEIIFPLDQATRALAKINKSGEKKLLLLT